MKAKWTTIIVLTAALLILGCNPGSSEKGEALTPDEARTIAKEAYIFNYSMVMMYRTMYLQSIDTHLQRRTAVDLVKWLHSGYIFAEGYRYRDSE